jgi:hypothetical protein
MVASIDEHASVVADEAASVIRAVRPSGGDILHLQRQLLARHADLHLKAIVSAEEVVEGLLRCHLADHLARRFRIPADALPFCMNASHKAVRRVCLAPQQHHHLPVPEAVWAEGWLEMQTRFPQVNVRVPGHRSPKRADLYMVAQSQVVSLEFKYISASGFRGVDACIAQMRRHAENHNRALFVVYAALNADVDLARMNSGLLRNSLVVSTSGPSIEPFRGAA